MLTNQPPDDLWSPSHPFQGDYHDAVWRRVTLENDTPAPGASVAI
ncbi:MAG: hypothetical protein V4850_25425 [Myxococcota bacterium]